jgi:hypoxia up-regulated 1
LVEYFADEFNAQVGGGIDVRKFPGYDQVKETG